MKIKFDKTKKEWIELDSESKEGIYIDGFLYDKLKNVRKILKKGFDCPIILDGGRREGKSILGMTIAWILSDETLTLDNFAIGIDDAIEKLKKLPDRSILFVDEGSMVFNSKDAMQKELRQMVKILDVIGQKEMIFIIVLPSFFDLIRPVASRMSRFLLHVYTDEQMNRGRFAFFGKKSKNLLYVIGKKNYDSYARPSADFVGRFTDFKVPFYDAYLRHKTKTLFKALEKPSKEISKSDLNKFRKEIVKEVEERGKKIPIEQLSDVLGVDIRTIARYKAECRKNNA